MCRILPPAYFDAALAGAARDQAVLAELLLSQAVPGLLTHLANLSGLISGPLRGHKLGTKSSVLEEERPSALGLGPPLSPLSSDGVHGPPKAFTTPRKGVIDITVVARRDELRCVDIAVPVASSQTILCVGAVMRKTFNAAGRRVWQKRLINCNVFKSD